MEKIKNHKIRAWKDYLDHLYTRTSAEVWVPKRQDLFVELMHKIAICLNYKFEKIDIRKTSYFPEDLGKVQRLQNTILERFGEILNGDRGFPVTNYPDVDEIMKEKTKNIINGIEEVISGKRSIAVTSPSVDNL